MCPVKEAEQNIEAKLQGVLDGSVKIVTVRNDFRWFPRPQLEAKQSSI